MKGYGYNLDVVCVSVVLWRCSLSFGNVFEKLMMDARAPNTTSNCEGLKAVYTCTIFVIAKLHYYKVIWSLKVCLKVRRCCWWGVWWVSTHVLHMLAVTDLRLSIVLIYKYIIFDEDRLRGNHVCCW